MAQLIISLGATKKQILGLNKIEAKNYIDVVKKPVFVISEYETLYSNDSDFQSLSYHLLSNIKKPSLIAVENKSMIQQALSAALTRINEGLLIIDMPSNKEQCHEMFDLLSKNTNDKIQVVINLPNLEYCEDSLHKLHTGWRLFSSVSKKDFDWLKENIGDLDAIGLTITGALREEYVKTYKEWCKAEKNKPEQSMLNIPFYYSLSTIIIKPEVFKELIGKVLENLKLFDIHYTPEDVKEMYL